jgi:hypothetical protein
LKRHFSNLPVFEEEPLSVWFAAGECLIRRSLETKSESSDGANTRPRGLGAN